MKTLIIGAGPLGSLYTHLFNKAGHDVTLLARNEHFKYLKENGITLVNEFTNEKIDEHVKVTNKLSKNDSYDLAIVLMRKNSVKKILPLLGELENVSNILLLMKKSTKNSIPKTNIWYSFFYFWAHFLKYHKTSY
jgi:2-dehydropantoate 2-reductase